LHSEAKQPRSVRHTPDQTGCCIKSNASRETARDDLVTHRADGSLNRHSRAKRAADAHTREADRADFEWRVDSERELDTRLLTIAADG